MTTTYCPSCGYNLYGIPEVRCPECGFHYDYAGITALAEDESLRSYWAKLAIMRAAFALAFAAPALSTLAPCSAIACFVTVFSLLVGAVVLRQYLIGATPYQFWESLPVAWLFQAIGGGYHHRKLGTSVEMLRDLYAIQLRNPPLSAAGRSS